MFESSFGFLSPSIVIIAIHQSFTSQSKEIGALRKDVDSKAPLQ
jgi:hypothetical protein